MNKFTIDNIEWFSVIGYSGAILYLISYALLNLKKINGNGINYIITNLFAASAVAISCIQNWNGPSFLIQSCWIFFSLIGIVKILNIKRKNKKITMLK